MKLTIYEPSPLQASVVDEETEDKIAGVHDYKPIFFMKNAVITRFSVSSEFGELLDTCVLCIDGSSGRLSLKRPSTPKADVKSS